MRHGFFARFPVQASITAAQAGWLLGLALVGGIAIPAAAADQAAPAKPEAAKPSEPSTKRLELKTSDNATIAAWFYPKPEDAAEQGTVILVHDLGGSHQTVEPLAQTLQKAGYAVVSPDLRGHGESPLPTLPPPANGGDQSKALKKNDFEAMAATSGGRVRSQASVYGDLECVHAWITAEAEKGALARQPLFVVGSGLGGTLAATWTAADALWPPVISGPQGGQVSGLVLISPVYATRGFSLAPALGSDVLRRSLPLLIIDGSADRDGIKVFDQLKRQRPKQWFDSRQSAEERAEAGPANAKPTLYLLQSPLERTGDELAAHRSADPRKAAADPATLIIGFMSTAARQGR